MTDIKRFIELYKSFGINCIVSPNKDGFKIRFQQDDEFNCYEGYETVSSKFVGYYGFYSTVLFDSNGKFISQGFYE